MRAGSTIPVPQSPEAEAGALACVLRSDGQATALLRRLSLGLFNDLRHQRIYEVMQLLAVQGKPLSLLCLRDGLIQAKWLTDVGGAGYLAALEDATPSPSNFDYFLGVLRDRYARRALIDFGERSRAAALDESIDIQRAAQDAASLVQGILGLETEKQWFRFFSPTEFKQYEVPRDQLLVGDCHVMKGATTVIGGAAGIGKTRAGTYLAIAGAYCRDWFGLQVHRQFRTAILQNENGAHRLQHDFAGTDTSEIDDWIRISEPPDFGMAFDHPEFRFALAEWLSDWPPDCLIIDPWNSIARDDRQRDYLQTFENIYKALPCGRKGLALVIVAHTKKPQADVRRTGRALLAELSGSLVLGSVPRCVFVMQAASDDPTDDRIVWTCCKNNDGEEGDRSAWHRKNGVFRPCRDFGWDDFDKVAPRESTEPRIKPEDVAAFLRGAQMSYKRLVEQLMERFEICDRTAQRAIARAAEAGAVRKTDDDLYEPAPTADTPL